jgi:hypothetical protein
MKQNLKDIGFGLIAMGLILTLLLTIYYFL